MPQSHQQRGGSTASSTQPDLPNAAERCYGSLQAARRLRLSVNVLRALREGTDGPRFMANGITPVYRETDLAEWEAQLPALPKEVNFHALENAFEISDEGIVYRHDGRVFSRDVFLAACESRRHFYYLRMAEAWLRWGGER